MEAVRQLAARGRTMYTLMTAKIVNDGPFSTRSGKNSGWPTTEMEHKEKVKKIAVFEGQTRWPETGSNRRISDFQDSGGVFASGRHRP